MMLVAAEVRPSMIHGLGVFACTTIDAGAPVARWTDGVDYRLRSSEFDALPHELRTFLEEFVWMSNDGYFYGSVGNSRLINHARPANLTWDPQTKTSVANRVIHSGEELTEDYEQFDALFASYEEELKHVW